MTIGMTVLIAIIAAVVGALGGFFGFRGWDAMRNGSLQERKETLRREAELERDNLLKEAEAKAKEQALNARNEFEREARKRREEYTKNDKRIRQKEVTIDKKNEQLEHREQELKKKEQALNVRESKIEKDEQTISFMTDQVQNKLEEVSGLSREEARRRLMANLEESARIEAAKSIRLIEKEAAEEAHQRAHMVIASAMQRLAGEYVAEKTVSVVDLPSDEMKGRIIGREGRNIRALEAATGVDIIIDDTPEAVILSCFNPIRREIGKLSLERLISDGRIHPARIEEVVQKVTSEMALNIQKAGEQATFELGLHGLHPEIVKHIGKLKYRVTDGQNQLQHAIETGFIAGMLAAELGLKVKFARRAGLLHDIGKAVDQEIEGPHYAVGAELLKRYGERPEIVHAVRCHHEALEYSSPLDVIVQAADELSKNRPGAKKEAIDTYIRRLEDVEKVASSFAGVSKSYAIQAGREVRVMVDFNEIDDDKMFIICKDIAKKIEEDLTYPGQIRITVIRESRAMELAK